jgi:uncharacterized protein (TIGR03435 family)
VIDKTNLTGKHDFTLEYVSQRPDVDSCSPVDNGPSDDLFDAVRKQLSLKLVEVKEPFELVVIDHAERIPSENYMERPCQAPPGLTVF